MPKALTESDGIDSAFDFESVINSVSISNDFGADASCFDNALISFLGMPFKFANIEMSHLDCDLHRI